MILKKSDKLWDFLYSVIFSINYWMNIRKGLADFTVLTRNNIDHATVYISVCHAYV